MSKEQLVAEIRKPGPVFAFVKLTPDDGHYVQVVKGSLIQWTTDDTPGIEYLAERREDGLYIN